MFIEYGINKAGELVYIGQVDRGRTALHCPYCGGTLVARKGQIKVPHFAHVGETCRQAERSTDAIALPAYDNFNLHLPPKVLTALQAFPNLQYASEYELLERHELITMNKFARNRRGEYELTKLGKIPRGELSLNLFNEVQEDLLLTRHNALEQRVRDIYMQRDQIKVANERIPQITQRLSELDALLNASTSLRPTAGLWDKQLERDSLESELRHLRDILAVDINTALVDLRLYRAQWRRILSTTLYFLIIGDGTLRKIGVTTRPVAERVAEVVMDMREYLNDSLNKSIRVLGTWDHRGNVELYFKHRYKRFNAPQGTLTEYYQVSFEEGAAMLTDLKRMKPKTLTELERAVLAGEPSAVERMIQRDQIEAKRRTNIQAGLQRRIASGKPTGRPARAETREQLLAKPTSRAIIKFLNSGLSLREIAALAGVAVNTVRKVKAALEGSQKM
jgi:hypothetical protein